MLLVLDLKTQVFLTLKNWIWLETFVSSFLICLSTFQPHKWSFNSHTVLKNSEQAPRYYFACSCFSHCEASLHHGLHNSLSQRNPQKACYLNINWPSCSMLIDILEINLHANAPSDAYIYIYICLQVYMCLHACQWAHLLLLHLFWGFVVHQPMAGQTVVLICAALSDQNHDIICFHNLLECCLWCCGSSITGHQFLLKRY